MRFDRLDSRASNYRQRLNVGIRLVVAAFVIYLCIRSQRGWSDAAFWSAGLQQAHAGNWAGIYDPAVNRYAMRGFSPVALYIVLYPLGYLNEAAMRLVIAGGILAMWFLAWRLISAGLKGLQTPMAESESTTPLPGMVLCQRFLGSDLVANQINALSFAPACLGMGLMLKRSWLRTLTGGMLLALTTGMKMYPLALIGILWVKRAWREAAVASMLAVAAIWLLPWAILGPTEFARVRAQQASSAGSDMWMHDESFELWGLPNFLHYRCYTKPWFSGTETIPPVYFQIAMAGVTAIVGLFVLPALTRCRWSETTAAELLEDIAIVGVAICLVDPVGRTAHFVMAVPAHCLLVAGWVNAWRRRRELPGAFTCIAYGFVLLANNFLLVSMPGSRHTWYMHYGVFPLGMLTLVALVRQSVLSRHCQADIVVTQESNPASYRQAA